VYRLRSGVLGSGNAVGAGIRVSVSYRIHQGQKRCNSTEIENSTGEKNSLNNSKNLLAANTQN
jgi:hypothetical protein